MYFIMLIKTKKKLTFFCIGIFFFLGGVEYAVILPTANLYLVKEFQSKPYMLGLMLSAFCLSGLIAAPIMGRWSDKTGHTKLMLLLANLFEITGNVMYILKVSDWFLVGSRFVAGVGTGVGSALFADIARVTTSDERTATMAMFMAVRQFGLVIGPGFNLFLRKINFPIGSVVIDKYTAPGAFMAVLWLAFQVIVMFCFWNLPKLQSQAKEEYIRREVDYSYHHRQLRNDSMLPPSQSSDLPSPGTDVLHQHNPTQPLHNVIDTIIEAPECNGHIPQVNRLTNPTELTSSNEIMEKAERFMSSSFEDSGSDHQIRHVSFDEPGSLYDLGTYDPDHFALDEEEESTLVGYSSRTSNTLGNASPLALGQYVSYGAILRSPSQDENQQTTYPSHSFPTSKPWRYYYDEYCREEVIVLLATVFIALFDQLALETMVTPLSKSLLNWEELENSLLYCGAGVFIIIIFVIIRCASRCLQDRTLLLFGFLIATSVNIFLVWYLPNAKLYDSSHPYENLPFLMLGVFLNLTGIPFLMVASVSLYSKVTHEETQGFSQGLRRMSGGLGNLLGPLWAGALIHKPVIMMGVMVAIMLLGSGMLILSFRKLSSSIPVQWNDQLSVNADPNRRTSQSSEHDPLLPHAS